ITLLGSGGQCQLQRFENHIGRHTLFIGYRLNNQQYFFTHRTPRLSQSIGDPADPRLKAVAYRASCMSNDTPAGPAILRPPPSIKTGNYVGLVDRIDRQKVFVIIHQHHDILLLHTTEKPLEIAPPLERRAQSDLYLLAGMPGELLEREQR